MILRLFSEIRITFWLMLTLFVGLWLARTVWVETLFSTLHTAFSVSSAQAAVKAVTPPSPALEGIISRLEGNRHLSFHLRRENNEIATDMDYSGKILLVFFGFTSCPVICPTALGTLSRVFETLPPTAKDHFQPLFITIDPERDTVGRLKDYSSLYHPAIHYLTGTLSEVDTAAKSVHSYYNRNKKSADDTGYMADHSTFIYVVNEKREVIGIIQDKASIKGIVAYLEGLVEGQ